MVSSPSVLLSAWRHPKSVLYLLLGTLGGLAAIHLTLTWRADNSDLFGSYALFFAAVAVLLREKYRDLKLESTGLASGFGLLLLAFILLRCLTIPSGTFLQLSPLISFLGVACLASGFKGLRQYARELAILFFLGVPSVVLPTYIDLTPLTAKFATLILWYSGFQVIQDGLNIRLASGAVEVYPGCSGIEGVTHLLSLAGLFLVMFSMSWLRRGVVLVMAVTVAFLVNAVRVALLAHLVDSSDMAAFDYWHLGDGSLIFSTISVGIFGCVCWLLLKSADEDEYPDDHETGDYQES